MDSIRGKNAKWETSKWDEFRWMKPNWVKFNEAKKNESMEKALFVNGIHLRELDTRAFLKFDKHTKNARDDKLIKIKCSNLIKNIHKFVCFCFGIYVVFVKENVVIWSAKWVHESFVLTTFP